jgi:hypothetical protein
VLSLSKHSKNEQTCSFYPNVVLKNKQGSFPLLVFHPFKLFLKSLTSLYFRVLLLGVSGSFEDCSVPKIKQFILFWFLTDQACSRNTVVFPLGVCNLEIRKQSQRNLYLIYFATTRPGIRCRHSSPVTATVSQFFKKVQGAVSHNSLVHT